MPEPSGKRVRIPTVGEIALARSHDCLISDYIYDYVDTADWARRAAELVREIQFDLAYACLESIDPSAPYKTGKALLEPISVLLWELADEPQRHRH